MKKILSLLAILILSVGTLAARDKYFHDASPLPTQSKTLIKKYFPNTKVAQVKVDSGVFGVEDYEVVLSNGTKIDFDKKGNWEAIDGGRNAVPNQLLLRSIRQFISSNYAGAKITKIDKERYNYEVELSNGIDLKFDRSGKFLRID